MLPSAALMPPRAATVWRVGKTLLMQAVDRPASDSPHGRPQAGAARTYDDVEAVVDERVSLRHGVTPTATITTANTPAIARARCATYETHITTASSPFAWM